MLVCGHGVGGALSFSIITYEETLDIHFNITSSTSTFTVQTSAQYPVSYSAVSTMTISSYTVTNSTLTSYVTSEVSNSDQFLSDISYWLRDYYAYNLVHNTYIGKNSYFHIFRKRNQSYLFIKRIISKHCPLIADLDCHAYKDCKRS